jgi:hypothetical protein
MEGDDVVGDREPEPGPRRLGKRTVEARSARRSVPADRRMPTPSSATLSRRSTPIRAVHVTVDTAWCDVVEHCARRARAVAVPDGCAGDRWCRSRATRLRSRRASVAIRRDRQCAVRRSSPYVDDAGARVVASRCRRTVVEDVALGGLPVGLLRMRYRAGADPVRGLRSSWLPPTNRRWRSVAPSSRASIAFIVRDNRPISSAVIGSGTRR